MKRLQFVWFLGMGLACNAFADPLADAEEQLKAVAEKCRGSQLALVPSYSAGTAFYDLPQELLRFLACEKDARAEALRRYGRLNRDAYSELLIGVINTITSQPWYTVVEPPDAKQTGLRSFQLRLTIKN